MSNFCCNDDFNANGIFDAFDLDLYDVFVSTCVSEGTCPQTVQELLDKYNKAVSDGVKPPLVGGLDHLPEFDCSDFNLNGIFDAFDLDLYDVFVSTCVSEGTCPQTVQELLDKYDKAVSDGVKPPLVGGIDHLPRLTPTGCEEPNIWDTAGDADKDGLVIITPNKTTDVGTIPGETTTTDGDCEYEPFTATGADQEYIVPEGVTDIFAHVWGAGGSSGRYVNTAGAGGYAEGQFAVTPGEKLIIGVGQTSQGTDNNTKRIPGYSIGGSAGHGGDGVYDATPSDKLPNADGTSGAGAGGGMSAIFRESISSENALIIAGGGGGAANVTYPGAGAGAGGGLNAGHGSRLPDDNTGGQGGTQTSGGQGQFTGGDGNHDGWASAGGGGAGWYGGAGGTVHSSTWSDESQSGAAQESGGGGSGYLDNVVEFGILTTGNKGELGSDVEIKSPKPSELKCTDDVVYCTPDFMCIEEPGNGSDIPPNLLGLGGTYEHKLAGTVGGSNGVEDWIRLTNYAGQSVPPISEDSYGGGLFNHGTAETPNWVFSTSGWGYSDYVQNNPSLWEGPDFKFYDFNGNETTCLPRATSVAFHLDWDKRIPIIVSPTECPPTNCTFEISNITDTEPTGPENTIGTFDLTVVLGSLDATDTNGFVRAMEAEFAGIELAKNNAIVATTFDSYKEVPATPILEPTLMGNSPFHGPWNSFFGYSTSLSDDGKIIAIGGYKGTAPSSEDTGLIQIYEYNETSWVQLGTNLYGLEGDKSGWSVSLNGAGNILAVGAPTPSYDGPGMVRIYEYDGTDEFNWVELGDPIVGEQMYDAFGACVSLNSAGSRVAIGATFAPGTADLGVTKVYEYNASHQIWEQLGQSIEGSKMQSLSGLSVELSSDGNVLVIGAPNDFELSSGSTRVYELVGGDSWVQLGSDFIGEEASRSGYTSLSADGKIVAIGAWNGNIETGSSGTGHVRIYEYSENTWNQLGGDLEGASLHVSFGRSVSLSADGKIVAIGEPKYNIDKRENHFNTIGKVWVYEYTDGVWVSRNEIEGPSTTKDFGRFVRLSADGQIVASSSYQYGRVWVYELPVPVESGATAPPPSAEEQALWGELSNRTQTILSDIGETTQSRNKIMFADLLQNQGFRLADYANTTLTFTISYTQKFTDYFYVSSAEFYDSSTDINNFHGVICTPNTPTPSPSITPSPTISPTITSTPTTTPSPTVCFEASFCITEFNNLYGLHGNYELVEEESGVEGATYVAVESLQSLNETTHTPIKLKQIGGYTSHVWQIQKSDPTKIAWFTNDLTNNYLDTDLYFYDENMNPEHCIGNVRYIQLEDVVIKSHGSAGNQDRVDGSSTYRYIISTDLNLYVAGTSNAGYLQPKTNPLLNEDLLEENLYFCNPLGIDYQYPSWVSHPEYGMAHYGIYYRNWQNDFDYYQKLPLSGVVKVRTSSGNGNTGMLIQTDTGQVYGTGHYKTSITENISEITDLNGVDIDELVSVSTVYYLDASEQAGEPIFNFAFAYIDKNNNSKLVYYVPTFDMLTDEEYTTKYPKFSAEIQANMPFVTGYTKVETSGMENVRKIIPLGDEGFFCIQVNEFHELQGFALYVHGAIGTMPTSYEYMRKPVTFQTSSDWFNYPISFIDYSDAFQGGNQTWTEVQGLHGEIPTILYTTTQEQPLLSPVVFHVASTLYPESRTTYMDQIRYIQPKLFKRGTDYDTTPDTFMETTTMFRPLLVNYNTPANANSISSQFLVGLNSRDEGPDGSETFVFGHLSVTNKIEFKHIEDATGLTTAVPAGSMIPLLPQPIQDSDWIDFYTNYAPIKISFASYSRIVNEEVFWDDGIGGPSPRSFGAPITVVSVLYASGLVQTIAFENTRNTNPDAALYNLSSTDIIDWGSRTNATDINAHGYYLDSGQSEDEYVFYENDGFDGEARKDRRKIVKWGLGLSQIFITPDCRFYTPTPTPSRTTSYTPSPTFTACGEPDYTGVENASVCIADVWKLNFGGFDEHGRPMFTAENEPSSLPPVNLFYDHGMSYWVLSVCGGGNDSQCDWGGWTHSIPTMCDFYPWEVEWPQSDNDSRIDFGDKSVDDYWSDLGPFDQDYWLGPIDPLDCTPCDACLVEPNQYKLVPGGLPAVNSLSAEWYRNFGGTLCYGSIHYDATTTNFEIFKTYYVYVEDETFTSCSGSSICVSGLSTSEADGEYCFYRNLPGHSTSHNGRRLVEYKHRDPYLPYKLNIDKKYWTIGNYTTGMTSAYHRHLKTITNTETAEVIWTHDPGTLAFKGKYNLWMSDNFPLGTFGNVAITSGTCDPSPAPLGTITITGDFVSSQQITYQSPSHECYVGYPTIEEDKNVYRFTKDVPTPSPTYTSSPTHIPTPTYTPSPTHTPSPSETPAIECTVAVSSGSFNNFPPTAPAAHEAGATYYWCAGTTYADPGVHSPLLDSCGVNVDANVVTTYWTNHNHHTNDQGTQIVGQEIDKLGMIEGPTGLGSAPYMFSVTYEVTSSTGTIAKTGRSIWVFAPGEFPENKLCSIGCKDTGCDPCNPHPHSCECCEEGMTTETISINTETEFGSPTITATAFTINAEVCVNVTDGGLPNSVKLKIDNAIIGVLTTTGILSGTIYVKNTDAGVCYAGTISDDECPLTILQ